MSEELLAKVMELLEPAGRQEGGLGFSQVSATVRRCAVSGRLYMMRC